MELFWLGVAVLAISCIVSAFIIGRAVREWQEAVRERQFAVTAYEQAAAHLEEALFAIDNGLPIAERRSTGES